MNSPNKLIAEKSPYLLQHAYNPVNWNPWGETAFEQAKSENKVVFLSIGYATCHWCHVMERESFEDIGTAELLNQNFICIKLDREERPDIDKIYMDALHAMGQQGGWPLNLFLTPEKLPILGGTYFPPEPRYGRKSFKDILTLVQRAWENQKDDLIQSAEELTNYLRGLEKKQNSEIQISDDIFKNSLDRYKKVYDKNFYGFITNNQNKFPPSMGLSYLLALSKIYKDEFALEIVYNSAFAMKSGGIYDQIGGGISRYATDHEWLVPHFEKMLYDNSLFLKLLSELYKVTKEDFFLNSLLDIINYVNRDLLLLEGGISSAEDADSEGEEGKFYIWDEYEIKNAKISKKVLEYWNVTSIGNFEGKNILNVTINGQNPYNDNQILIPEFIDELNEAKKNLLEIRNTRIRPLRDDKVITSWNCLYIQALISAYQATNKMELLTSAISIHQFLTDKLRTGDGFLFRRYRDGEAKFEGNLTDYVEFILASLLLFQETENEKYFTYAKENLKIIFQNFKSDFGPFYDSISHNKDLILRTIDGYDGVEPSGNSSLTTIFLLLSKWGYKSEEFYAHAKQIFSHFSKELNSNSMSYPVMLNSLLQFTYPSIEVVVIYKKECNEEVTEIRNGLRTIFSPFINYLILEESNALHLSHELTLLKDRNAGDSHLVYVCKDFVCSMPVRGWEKTKELIIDL